MRSGLGLVRLHWPRPHGLYLAPFPEECRGTPNIRVQPVSFSTLYTKCLPPHCPQNKTINDKINDTTKGYRLTQVNKERNAQP